MVTTQSIMDVLGKIDDPEMPISIVDLGMVEKVELKESDNCKQIYKSPNDTASSEVLQIKNYLCTVHIDVLPTFVGCPALAMIEDEIKTKVSRLNGVDKVTVRFIFDPPWSVDRISDAGRQSLEHFGVTVPNRTILHSDESVQLGTPHPVACPFCKSKDIRLDSPFGPTRCRMIYYCNACKNVFEHMKRV